MLVSFFKPCRLQHNIYLSFILNKKLLFILCCRAIFQIIFLAHNSGIVIGNLTMKRFWYNIKRQSILNVIYVTRNYTRDPDCQYIVCRYARPIFLASAPPAHAFSLQYFFSSLLIGRVYFGTFHAPYCTLTLVKRKYLA